MNTCGIFGEPGTGKSHLLDKIVQAHESDDRRIWVANPFESVGGTNVGTVQDFCNRKSWPSISRFDVEPEDVLELALQVQDVTVVCDEISRWVGAKDKVPSVLKEVCSRGRHHRVYLLYTAQHPFDIPDFLRRSTYSHLFYRISAQSTRNYLAQSFGVELADAVRNHQGYSPLYFDQSQRLRKLEVA